MNDKDEDYAADMELNPDETSQIGAASSNAGRTKKELTELNFMNQHALAKEMMKKDINLTALITRFFEAEVESTKQNNERIQKTLDALVSAVREQTAVLKDLKDSIQD